MNTDELLRYPTRVDMGGRGVLNLALPSGWEVATETGSPEVPFAATATENSGTPGLTATIAVDRNVDVALGEWQTAVDRYFFATVGSYRVVDLTLLDHDVWQVRRTARCLLSTGVALTMRQSATLLNGVGIGLSVTGLTSEYPAWAAVAEAIEKGARLDEQG